MFPAESVQIASTDRFATCELVEKGAVNWVHFFSEHQLLNRKSNSTKNGSSSLENQSFGGTF